MATSEPTCVQPCAADQVPQSHREGKSDVSNNWVMTSNMAGSPSSRDLPAAVYPQANADNDPQSYRQSNWRRVAGGHGRHPSFPVQEGKGELLPPGSGWRKPADQGADAPPARRSC